MILHERAYQKVESVRRAGLGQWKQGGVREEVARNNPFGEAYAPREWFLLPLPTIEEAIERIKAGEIDGYGYDAAAARVVKRR